MNIFTSAQIREWDQFTIENEPISSPNLMERASHAFVLRLVQQYDTRFPIYIFCGLGNNGGDGLVVSRLLLERGYAIHPYIVRHSDKSSPDFDLNLERLKSLIPVPKILEAADFPIIPSHALVIDAIFGSGLNKALDGLCAALIQMLNQSPGIKIALDIPSGLFADKVSEGEAIFKAQQTFTFQVPKLGFFFPENEAYTGELSVLPIGLKKEFLDQSTTHYFYTTEEDIQKLLKKRQRFAHKGSYGRALISAGSYGKAGAAVLSARACMRTGVGLLSVHVPHIAVNVLQTAIPEAMLIPDAQERYISSIPLEFAADAIGIGPGWDTQIETGMALGQLLEKYHKPMVIDADALNLLSQNKELLKLLPPNSILSPHPKEFERLVGKTAHFEERLQVLRSFSQEYKVLVLLKGHYTAIADPEGNVYFNSTGNPGMATAGSGDVLTGILTALLAQGYTSLEAARLGAFLHGRAGDLAARERGMESMIASDIIENLGKAFLSLG